MQVMLPQGLMVDWSLDQIAEAAQICMRQLHLAATGRPSIGLQANIPGVVSCGEHECRLTPTQHALVRLLLARGPSTYQDAIDVVWIGKEISDGRVRKTASEISNIFFDAGIPYHLSAAGGVISFISDCPQTVRESAQFAHNPPID